MSLIMYYILYTLFKIKMIVDSQLLRGGMASFQITDIDFWGEASDKTSSYHHRLPFLF